VDEPQDTGEQGREPGILKSPPIPGQGQCFVQKEIKEYAVCDVNQDVDKMVPGHMAAVEIRVESEGEIGQGPTTEQTAESGFDEIPDGKRPKWRQVIPQVGDIIQIEWDVECVAVKKASQHHKGE